MWQMASISFDMGVEQALAVLRGGGVILYPTDTIWGIGCDATNAEAVQRIYTIKQRADSKALIILLADERDMLQYVAAPDPAVLILLQRRRGRPPLFLKVLLGCLTTSLPTMDRLPSAL